MITAGRVNHLEVPETMQTYLAKIGGSNQYGEPRFRIVWSGSRTTMQNRRWFVPGTTSSAAKSWVGIGTTLKYKQPARRERFVIEVFRPAEFYGDPETWETKHTKLEDGKLTMALGPFPVRGAYEYLDTIEAVDEDGTRHFLQPTEAYLDTVVQMFYALLDMPTWQIEDQVHGADAAKRQSDYDYTLEMVKRATDPKFSPVQVAYDNLSALGADDYMARNATVPSL